MKVWGPQYGLGEAGLIRWKVWDSKVKSSKPPNRDSDSILAPIGSGKEN